MPLSEAQMKQKMAKSVSRKSPGSSLIPPGIGSTPAEPKREAKPDAEVIPTIDELIPDIDEDAAEIRLQLKTMAQQYKQFSQVESGAKKNKEGLSKRIKFILGGYGIAKVLCGSFKVTVTPTQRKTINPMLLLANGVTQEIIDASTETTESSTINVSEVKG